MGCASSSTKLHPQEQPPAQPDPPPLSPRDLSMQSLGIFHSIPSMYSDGFGSGSGSMILSFSSFMNQVGEKRLFEYAYTQLLGRGSHAKVYQVVNTKTDVIYAAKVYDKGLLSQCEIGETETPFERMLCELQIMTRLQHDHCIRLYEVLEDDVTNSISLIMSYADQGSLFPSSQDAFALPEEQIKIVLHDITDAILYIHNQGILHRDVKPENILMSSENGPVLSDFSASTMIDSSNGDDVLLDDTCGTPIFYSPEECTGKPYYGKPTDIWALGVTTYIMVYGHFPYKDDNFGGGYLSHFARLAEQIRSKPINFYDAHISEELMTLMKKMLDKNPETRITAEQILKDPYFLS